MVTESGLTKDVGPLDSVHELMKVGGSHRYYCSDTQCKWDEKDAKKNNFLNPQSYYNAWHRNCSTQFVAVPIDEFPESNEQSGEIRTTSSTGGQKGVKPERFNLVPIGPLTHLSRHLAAGARKYADHNWRNGYEWSKGYDALLRHITEWWDGKDYDTCEAANNVGCSFEDKEGNPIDWAVPGKICYNHTGNHHLDGVMFHSFTLREFVEHHPQFDDRFKR